MNLIGTLEGLFAYMCVCVCAISVQKKPREKYFYFKRLKTRERKFTRLYIKFVSVVFSFMLNDAKNVMFYASAFRSSRAAVGHLVLIAALLRRKLFSEYFTRNVLIVYIKFKWYFIL